MDMHGGAHSASEGLFTTVNRRYARAYWYCVAACVGLATAKRCFDHFQGRRRQSSHIKHPQRTSSRPRGMVQQAYATTTAIAREVVYPQPLHFTGRTSRYFTPVPVGHWVLLAFYWAIILALLWYDVILKPDDPLYGYKWEKPAYRAAWISITQVPLVYLLSCKLNPISLLTGISYERFNWLHRWAARTLFLTVIVHWAYFYHQWRLAGFVKTQLAMMPMVKYGFGAWAVVGWMVLSGFGFFRSKCYEVFVLQHIAAAAVLLWLLHKHVPSYAAYHIWMAVGFIALDWSARLVWNLGRNLHLFSRVRPKRTGFLARLEPLPGDVVRATIDDTDFEWKAGQHVYLSVPRVRAFELHPFTIASAPKPGQRRQLTLLIKAQSGFTRSLHKAAQSPSAEQRCVKVVLSGPWGFPPSLRQYDSAVLIACASGAAFCVPLLLDLLRRPGCVQRATLHWIVRSRGHICWFNSQLEEMMTVARQGHVDLHIIIHVTDRADCPSPESLEDRIPSASASSTESRTEREQRTESDDAWSNDEKAALCDDSTRPHVVSLVTRHNGRPVLDAMVRPTVEAAAGETAVVVCGGGSITAQARTFVAELSDERAVHKGTGAQGIFLFTETFGW